MSNHNREVERLASQVDKLPESRLFKQLAMLTPYAEHVAEPARARLRTSLDEMQHELQRLIDLWNPEQ